ncbi:MAG TPA: PAS domain S-box protein [Terriglobales bacterium]|nr:PAS domain S-box protein [Terriglobales bacterium]
MQPVRILIADDHEVVRRGVRSLLKSRADWEVCGEAVDGRDAVQKAKELKPDVIVMDIGMPYLNGLEAARVIRKEVPQSEILILSQHEAAEMRPAALQAGAREYITKSDVARDLLAAVESVSRQVVASSSSQQLKTSVPTNGKIPPGISSSDVALPKRAEEERAWLASIVESSDDAIISKNLDGIITSWNGAAERIFEYTAEEAVGQPVKLIIPLERHEEENRILDRLRNGERIDHYESVRVSKSGRRIDVSLTISPVRNAEGKIVGGSKIARDITERKQAEEALRRIHDELELRVRERTAELERRTMQVLEQAELLDLANDAIFVRNLDARITYWNQGAERLYGWSRSEVLGKLIDDYLKTQFPRPFAEVRAEILRTGSWQGRLIHSTKDGRRVTVASRWSLWSRDGKPLGFLELNTDLTEQKRVEESLRTMSGRLLQMQDEERRRIARELHDSAGQMLVALDMNLTAIREESKNPSAKAARACAESLELVQQMSKELRTISHLLHPPLLDEAGLPSAIRWFVEGFAERSKIAVELELSEDLGRLSPESETTVFRIVQESLSNIHRHSQSPKASIRICRTPSEVRVEVSDSGKGMPAGVQNGPTGSRRPGVGITGMRERLRQLGGYLEISSRKTGTTVLAVLPLGDSSAEDVSQAVKLAS